MDFGLGAGQIGGVRSLGRKKFRTAKMVTSSHIYIFSWIGSLLIVADTGALSALTSPGPSSKATIDFDREIRPIFSENCYQCHGPDEKARKAKLRLDTKEGAFRVLDGQSVIIPGKSAQSELIKRVTNPD